MTPPAEMLRIRQSSRRPSTISVPTRKILMSRSSPRRSGGSGTAFEKEKPVSTVRSSASIGLSSREPLLFILPDILLLNGFKKSLLLPPLYPHSKGRIVHASVTSFV